MKIFKKRFKQVVAFFMSVVICITTLGQSSNVDVKAAEQENVKFMSLIKDLGKQLKKIGMLVVQDQVWGRVTENRADGSLHGGNLEAFQKMGRNPDRTYTERERPSGIQGSGDHL